MKKVILCLAVVWLGSGFKPIHEFENDKVIWEDNTHDFGLVEKGATATVDFSFLNNSESDVRVVEVKASCGCTVTDYTKQAIQPGGSGTVSATYKGSHSGRFKKSIKVFLSNSSEPKVLFLEGIVKE